MREHEPDLLDGLSIRTYSCLKLAGIGSVKDIAELTFDDLMKMRNLGRKSLGEIISYMQEQGYNVEGGRFKKAACGPDYCDL